MRLCIWVRTAAHLGEVLSEIWNCKFCLHTQWKTKTLFTLITMWMVWLWAKSHNIDADIYFRYRISIWSFCAVSDYGVVFKVSWMDFFCLHFDPMPTKAYTHTHIALYCICPYMHFEFCALFIWNINQKWKWVAIIHVSRSFFFDLGAFAHSTVCACMCMW